MKLKKLLLLGMCLGIICGCSSNETKKEGTAAISDKKSVDLYEGLNAKETYQKACDYFDKNVNYVKEIYVSRTDIENPEVSCTEVYRENGKKNGVGKWISKFMSILEVYKDEKYFEIMGGTSSELTSEQQKNEYDSKQGKLFISLLDPRKDSGIQREIVNVERKNQGNEIVINIQYKEKSSSIDADGNRKWDEEQYKIRDTYIDENGIIYKVDSYSCGENFTDPIKVGTSTMSDFNKKSSFDYNQEVKNLDKYKNMSLDEFKKELGV